jgi:hypothetical protein
MITRSCVRQKCSDLVALFLKRSVIASKMCFYSLQYILTIRNLQRKMKRHMTIKQKCIEELEDSWNTQ